MSIFSDETIMRYVDGELDAETSGRLEAALATDGDLSRRLELFAETRLAAQQALKPLLDEEVPPALRAAVEAMVSKTKVEARQDETPKPAPADVARILAPANDWRKLAAAACMAGVVGIAIGFFARGDRESGGLRIADIGSESLTAALNSVATGSETLLAGEPTQFRAIASFRDSAQSLCREFELDLADGSTIVSVACRDNDWIVRFAVTTAGNEGGYAPASSSETLEAYLAAIHAGAPLSAEEESAALEKLRHKAE